MQRISAGQTNFDRPPREISIRHRSLVGCSGAPGELGLGNEYVSMREAQDTDKRAGRA